MSAGPILYELELTGSPGPPGCVLPLRSSFGLGVEEEGCEGGFCCMSGRAGGATGVSCANSATERPRNTPRRTAWKYCSEVTLLMVPGQLIYSSISLILQSFWTNREPLLLVSQRRTAWSPCDRRSQGIHSRQRYPDLHRTWIPITNRIIRDKRKRHRTFRPGHRGGHRLI